MMTDSESAPFLIFNNPHSSLVMARLHDQREAGLFCDVIIHVGTQTYAAHKNLLAASSPYFESVFLKDSLKEKELNADINIGPGHVTVNTVSVCPKTFCAVLDYMYLGRVSVEATCVTDVLMLADEFLLVSLKNYCFAYLEGQCTSISCLPNTTKSAEVSTLQQDISQCVNTNDYFQGMSTTTMPVLKSEVDSDNVEPNDLSKPCYDIPVTKRNSTRRYPNRRSVQIIEPDGMVLDAPRVVGSIELDAFVRVPRLTDNEIEKLNLCGSKTEDNEHTMLRGAVCKKQSRSNSPTKKMTNRNLTVKLKSNKIVSAGKSCVKLETAAEKNADEELKPSFKIAEVNNEVDTPQDCKPSESNIILKTVKEAEINNGRRKRGRPRKDAVLDETFVVRQSVAKFHCFWCDCKCKTKRELAKHATASHFPEPPYNCDTCGVTMNGVKELVKHRRSHLKSERSFDCEVCNKSFKMKVSLTQHLRNHTGERPHICPVCGRSVSTKGGLDRHIISHTDHRPWLCHLCGFSTQYQSLLIQHRREHNGNLFRCEMPNCKYAAKCRTHLKRHMRAHLQIRQHMCSRCPMAFVEKNHLKRHEAMHAGARPFKCDRCSYNCNRLDYLKAHKKRCGVTFNFFKADVGVD